MKTNFTKNTSIVVTQKKLDDEMTLHEVACTTAIAHVKDYEFYPEEPCYREQYSEKYSEVYTALLTAVQRGKLEFSDRGETPTPGVLEEHIWLHVDHVVEWMIDVSVMTPIKVPRELVAVSSLTDRFDMNASTEKLNLDLQKVIDGDTDENDKLDHYHSLSNNEFVTYKGEQTYASLSAKTKELERVNKSLNAQIIDERKKYQVLHREHSKLLTAYHQLVIKKISKIADDSVSVLLSTMYLLLTESTCQNEKPRYTSNKEMYEDLCQTFEDFKQFFSKRSFDQRMAELNKLASAYLRS